MTTDVLAAGPASEPQKFDWGEAYAYETDIRTRVLAERIVWFITIRWWMAGLCAVGAGVAALHLLPARVDWRVFAGTAAFLVCVNTIYHWGVRHHLRRRRLMVAQVLTDYGALCALSYATGSVEIPFPLLYVAHVILVSLFFPRLLSLLLTAVAFAFAVLPLLLEMTGVLRVVSVVDAPIKAAMVGDGRVLLLYGATLAGCYFFCWYLTSTITSSLKLRERQLEQSHMLLEKLHVEKTQAMLRATHELKAPFAAIKTYVYSLRDGYFGELPPKALEVIGRIGERCDRLTDMITAIIHVGNLRTTVVSTEDFEPVDMVKFLGPEVEEASVIGARRNISVTLETPPDTQLWVRGSPRHLHTLVSNLLRNAVTYSYDGGKVEVALLGVKDRVVLRVRDGGIGIAREAIPRIFDDFFRSNEAARRNPQGNGLGLALVREVAKLHGATIEVASEPGKGTCFWVWFPRLSSLTQGETNGKGTHH